MNKMILLFLALLNCACSKAIQLDETNKNYSGKSIYLVRNDLGGLVQNELERWKTIIGDERHKYIVVDGVCASFCAFASLNSDRSCYTKNVKLGFHGASILGLLPTKGTIALSRRLLSLLPTEIATHISTTGFEFMPAIMGFDLTYSDLKQIYPEGACSADVLRALRSSK